MKRANIAHRYDHEKPNTNVLINVPTIPDNKANLLPSKSAT